MSHTPVSQRLHQFVKSIHHASKKEVLGLLLNIFEEGIVKVYRSYNIYLNKAVQKNPIQSLSKIPISDYDIQVCLWLKQYIEDIFFFEMNTKYISSSVLKNIRIFMSAQHV